MQSCAFSTLHGFALENADWKEADVIHVADAPVSNSHDNVLRSALVVALGLMLAPIKGLIWLKNILQVAIETTHKFKINCRMTLGAFMRGFVMLFIEKPKPNQLHHWGHSGLPLNLHCLHWHWVSARRVAPLNWCTACCPWSSLGILAECGSGFCSRCRICCCVKCANLVLKLVCCQSAFLSNCIIPDILDPVLQPDPTFLFHIRYLFYR